MDDFEPSLPYNGTEGHSGTDTSRERAETEAINGVASTRQRFVLILAQRAGAKGITVAEIRDSRLHHGRISGTLSVLHKAGRLARLRLTRDKCKVYVLPEFIEGRQTEEFGRKKPGASKGSREAADRVEAWLTGLTTPFSDEMLFDVQRELNIEDLWALIKYTKGEID